MIEPTLIVCTETCMSSNIDDACVFNSPRIIVQFLNLSKSLSKECHIRKPTTTDERQIPDTLHTVTYGHVRQARTTGERIRRDVRHPIANRDACEPAATVERPISDALHTVRDCHTRKIGAIVERRIPDTRHICSDFNGNYVIRIFNLSCWYSITINNCNLTLNAYWCPFGVTIILYPSVSMSSRSRTPSCYHDVSTSKFSYCKYL